MFSIITGSGHCGTVWLSTVLNEGTDTTWHHHLRDELTDQPWWNLDHLTLENLIYNRYWSWIESEAQHGSVGDANSWPPYMLPAVNERFKIDRIIYLTRNGVQQLHSLTTKSPALSQSPLPEAAEAKLAALYDAAVHVNKPYSEWTRWERLCLMVAANDFMPLWLAGQGLPVEVCSLDDLIVVKGRHTDTDLLKELAPNLTKTKLKKWQKTDLNRKVDGERSPAMLWRKWTAERKDAYREVVGNPELS